VKRFEFNDDYAWVRDVLLDGETTSAGFSLSVMQVR
jgi:hypothetical protein